MLSYWTRYTAGYLRVWRYQRRQVRNGTSIGSHGRRGLHLFARYHACNGTGWF